MTEPTRRTDPIDAAIAAFQADISKAVEARRTLARDPNASLDELTKLTTQIQATKEKVAGQLELRQQAERLDARDAFLRARAEIKRRGEALLNTLKTDRVASARKLDQACTLMGEALAEIEAQNRAVWSEFVDVTRALGLNKRVCESAIDHNQSRVMTGAIAVTSLVHALKAAGLGTKGVMAGAAGDVFSSMQSFPTWSAWNGGEPLTIEQAMADAARRTEVDLLRLFNQAEADAEAADGGNGD